MDRTPSQHDTALALAEAGRHEQALALLRSHLLDHPADGEALNDAGAVLYALGRLDEAERHLRLAVGRLEEPAGPARANLVEVLLAQGRGEEAAGLLDALADDGLLTADLAHRTATVLVDAGHRGEAVEVLLRIGRLVPPGAAMGPILTALRKQRPKVALMGSESEVNRFVRERFDARHLAGGDADDLAAVLAWCEVAWFGRCGRHAATAGPWLGRRRVAVCVRPEDLAGPWFDEIVWRDVDRVVARGSEAFRDLLARRLPEHEADDAIRRIRPMVGVDALPLACRQAGTRLACLDGLELAGNPMFLLQCFRRLHRADRRAELFFAGYCDDDALARYLRHAVAELGLVGAVHFDGWQEDLPAWLADKHCVVSAGIEEGRLAGVLDAAAMGLRPVVHSFPGARDLLGEHALFATEAEFASRVLDGPHDPVASRRGVRERFGPDAVSRAVGMVLGELEAMPAPQRTREEADPPSEAFRPTWRGAQAGARQVCDGSLPAPDAEE